MSKRVDISGINPDLVIEQAKKSNREHKSVPPPETHIVSKETVQPLPEPEQETALIAEPEPAREVKEPSRRKRSQTAGYKETFLKRNEMKTRQCVYISYDVHAVIAKLVRALVSAGNDISVGGYIDTVLSEHLQANKDEINEMYRQQQGDLL